MSGHQRHFAVGVKQHDSHRLFVSEQRQGGRTVDVMRQCMLMPGTGARVSAEIIGKLSFAFDHGSGGDAAPFRRRGIETNMEFFEARHHVTGAGNSIKVTALIGQ